ncbi:hypothetical protein [Candidatus Skiveiella danica]|uniref:hypothetical protein n=1 Tax=Candidatus Skiveiella danica TaxID=3386177 RepID=UPI001DC8B814|nr:hypothetical protein [Betaproteobacteria bacterium]
MQGLLPENVLQRSDKAEFSVTFPRYWGELGQLLYTKVLPMRQNWADWQSVESMLQACSHPDPADWPGMAMWALWTLFGVDAASRAGCQSPRIDLVAAIDPAENELVGK